MNVSSGGENFFVPCYDLYILQIVNWTVDLNSTSSVLFTVCVGSPQQVGTTDSASTKIIIPKSTDSDYVIFFYICGCDQGLLDVTYFQCTIIHDEHTTPKTSQNLQFPLVPYPRGEDTSALNYFTSDFSLHTNLLWTGFTYSLRISNILVWISFG